MGKTIVYDLEDYVCTLIYEGIKHRKLCSLIHICTANLYNKA